MRFRKFLQRFQVEYLLRALKETFTRFPLSVTCAAVATVVSILEVHDIKPLSDDNLPRLLLFLSYGLVFFTAARLYAEGAKLTAMRAWAVTIAGGIGLAALVVVPDQFSAMHLFVMAALSLSMLFAPYIGRNSSEDSVWYFNYLNGLSLVVAGLSTVILCLGVCAIVGSMDYLLYDMKLSGKIFGDIWIFGGCFFGPVMFMHQVSRQFDFEKSECALLPGIYFIANFIVVPLILVYMWVLYVYFLKIASQWELPKGNLAYMVTGFGSMGIAARLAVFPMREEKGTQLLRQFYKYFHYLLIVPVVLLAVGLYTRLAQYGVTEDRYAIGICLAWLTALTVWNIARPTAAHIKHVPMALAVLFLFGAFGPWGAVSLSTRSQVARLDALLHQAGVVKADGTISRTGADVPFKLRQDISAIVDYMYDGKAQAIEKWVKPFGPFHDCSRRLFTRCAEDYSLPSEVMKAWGMQYVSRWQTAETEGAYVTINANGGNWYSGGIARVTPYSFALWTTANWSGPSSGKSWQDPDSKITVKIAMTGNGVLTATLSDGRQAVFDLMPAAEHFLKEHVTTVPANEVGEMTIKPAPGGFPAEVRILDLNGRGASGHFTLQGATLLLLFSP